VDNWTKVEDLFHAALGYPPEQRSDFLRQACDDRDIRGEVLALLENVQSDTFLEGSPPWHTQPAPPALAPGQKVGAFEIVELIGRGGMGEVYKARDTRLGRIVALKRLREQFSSRFEGEARAIAAVNHPNICTLYDIGPDYFVMEFLEGTTLSQYIAARRLTQGEIVETALQIAEALAAAHAKGIIHRDIKPGNIFVTGRLQIKVLDFGLAKLVDISGAERPTHSGSTMGTVAYMSPEQARGEPLDARTDLFSFGVVLSEMVNGATHELDRIIGKLLEKDRARRYQNAAEVLTDLRKLQGESTTPRHYAWWFVAAACLLAAVSASVVFRAQRKPASDQTRWQQLTNFPDTALLPSLSRDGRLLAFVRGSGSAVNNQLYIKVLPDGPPVAITRGVAANAFPAFSPDASKIAYTWGGWNTYAVPVMAGEPHLLLANATGLTWIDERRLLFSEIKTGIHLGLITATGSRAEARDVYVPQRQDGMVHFSALSPDGKQVLLGEMDRSGMLPCRVVPFDGSSLGKTVGPVPALCTGIGWSPDGKWMYVSAETGNGSHIWRQRTDGGAPEQLTFGPSTEEGIAVAPDGESLITSVGVSHNSVWIHDANGDRQISAEGSARDPFFSPDGARIFYTVTLRESFSGELWAADVASGRAEKVLPGIHVTGRSMSRDGRLIAYTTPDGGVWITSLDHRLAPRKLASDARGWVHVGSSGNVFFTVEWHGGNYLYRIAADGSGRRKILDVPFFRAVSLSPDEHCAALLLGDPNDPARTVLTIYPLDGRRPVRVCGNCGLTWAPDGRSVWIAYREGMSRAITAAIPLKDGAVFPPLPAAGIDDKAELESIPGAHIVRENRVVFQPGLSTWAWTSSNSQRNLYRIPLN